MVSVNGNFENKGKYYFTNDVAKKEIAEEKVEKQVVEETKPEFRERGEELLKAGSFTAPVNMFTVNEKLDREVASELTEMFAMAGISHRLPNAVEYARIAGVTKNATEQMTPFETEKHVQMLFNNSRAMNFLAEETKF